MLAQLLFDLVEEILLITYLALASPLHLYKVLRSELGQLLERHDQARTKFVKQYGSSAVFQLIFRESLFMAKAKNVHLLGGTCESHRL